MHRATAALLLCLCANAHAQEWTREEKITAAVAAAAAVIDWGQTRHIARNPDRWRELNPALPRHPTLGQVNRHFVGAFIAAAVLTKIFPEHRLLVLRIFAVSELGMVARNATIGIRVEF